MPEVRPFIQGDDVEVHFDATTTLQGTIIAFDKATANIILKNSTSGAIIIVKNYWYATDLVPAP